MMSDKRCHGVQQRMKAPNKIVMVLSAFLARFSVFFCRLRRLRSNSDSFWLRVMKFQKAVVVILGIGSCLKELLEGELLDLRLSSLLPFLSMFCSLRQ